MWKLNGSQWLQWCLTLVVAMGSLHYSENSQAQSLRPLISVPAKARNLPLLGDGLKDPTLAKRQPDNDIDAARLRDEIDEFKSDLARAQGDRRTELLMQLFESYVLYQYYLEDVVAGAVEGADRTRSLQQLTPVRNEAMRYATVYGKATKNKKEKARALYHTLASKYVSGQGLASTYKMLKQVVGNKYLNGFQKRRAEFIIALHELHYANANDKEKAAARVAGLLGSMPTESAVAGRLALARYSGGQNRNGAKQRAADTKKYRAYLWGASKKASRLTASQKQQALEFSIGVWRAAEGAKGTWSKPPFDLKAYIPNPAVNGIAERVALEHWRKGQHDRAISTYSAIAKDYIGQPTKAAIDLRILDLYAATYAKDKNAVRYQRNLIAMQNAYLDSSAMGEGNESKVEQMRQTILGRHKSLVSAATKRAMAGRIADKDRLATINLIEQYLLNVNDDKEREIHQANVAKIYALVGNHIEAVRIYSELSTSSVLGKQKSYVQAAIASQTILAHWTTKVPWSGVTSGHTIERETLFGFYQQLETLEGQVNWFVLGHKGLLEVSLGRSESAFTSWRTALEKAPQGIDAANATGLMLTTYDKSQNWEKLEDLSRFARGKAIRAEFSGKRLDVVALLGKSLLHGGKKALEEQNYALAVTKLEEFKKDFSKSKDHDEGYYLLATAYWGNRQHEQGIETLLGFVQKYPNSRLHNAALKFGGDWSVAMAFEENAMFFYRTFTKKYASDTETVRIREALLDLYNGRGIHAGAITVLNEQRQDSRLSGEQILRAYVDLLRTEERYGNMGRAFTVAQDLLKRVDANDEIKAHALIVMARYQYARNKWSEIARLEKDLQNLSQESFAASNALAETRYMLAEFHTAGMMKEVFNLGLKDPMATLAEQYKTYRQVRGGFQKVCHAGTSSYCAPAMHRLARISEEFISQLEEIAIVETLAKEKVDAFNQEKDKMMADLVNTAQFSDEKALAEIGKGQTGPDNTLAILWQNSADWNFDRVTGETGNAYVQWNAVINTSAPADDAVAE